MARNRGLPGQVSNIADRKACFKEDMVKYISRCSPPLCESKIRMASLSPGRTLCLDIPKHLSSSSPVLHEARLCPPGSVCSPAPPHPPENLKGSVEPGPRNPGASGILLGAERRAHSALGGGCGCCSYQDTKTQSSQGDAVPCDSRRGKDHLGTLNSERIQGPLASTGTK